MTLASHFVENSLGKVLISKCVFEAATRGL